MSIGVALLVVGVYAWITAPTEHQYVAFKPGKAALALERPIRVRFVNTTLKEAIETVAREANVTIDVNWDAVSLLNVNPDCPINGEWDVSPMPARHVLNALLLEMEPQSIACRIAGDTLQITARELLNRPKAEAIYDVSDLFRQRREFSDLLASCGGAPWERRPSRVITRQEQLNANEELEHALRMHLEGQDIIHGYDEPLVVWGERLVARETPENRQQFDRMFRMLRVEE